jgi:hypothetical protein
MDISEFAGVVLSDFINDGNVSERVIAFEHGRQMFRDNVFRPRDVWTDEEWAGPSTIGQCEYLGWMFERGKKLMAEYKERDRLEAWDRWANGDGPMPEE